MSDVWITGVGLVTALGAGRETTWKRLIAGESGIRPLTLFDPGGYRTAIAAQVPPFELPPLPRPLPRHSGRASRFAVAAAIEALTDARVETAAPLAGWGISLSGGAAGLLEAEAFVARRLALGRRARGLSELVEVPQDAPADRVAEVLAVSGPRVTISTACSSSTVAIGLAAEMIAAGEIDAALAGGSDALCRLTYAGFNSLRAVDVEPCKPFDSRRKGLTLGEGAALLVLESAARARRRGVRPLARVLGYGVTNDAFHMTQPEPSGAAWERTVRAALADAGIGAETIDYINAHGTGTEQNDPAECAAYARVLGGRLADVPISSTKGALGHCLCAAGAIEAAVTTLAVARGTVPPTAGHETLDSACPIDPVAGHGRRHDPRVALSSSFAFGGNSAAIVLARVE